MLSGKVKKTAKLYNIILLACFEMPIYAICSFGKAKRAVKLYNTILHKYQSHNNDKWGNVKTFCENN